MTHIDRWKEKYLQALEQQEQQEQRWQSRTDLLRRSLVRSSLAVEGADKAVDECMTEMRELLRRDDLDVGLSRLVPRLEKAVLDSERHRQSRVSATIEALERLAEQLHALPAPPEVRKGLKRFVKTLEARAAQTREWPNLLAELGGLQAQALATAGQQQPRTSLFERLFGKSGGPAVPAQAVEAPELAHVIDEPAPAACAGPAVSIACAESAPDEVADSSTEAAAAQVVADLTDILTVSIASAGEAGIVSAATDAPMRPAGRTSDALEDDGYALPPSPEPGYSAIAERVEATLHRLLDDLPLPDHHQPSAHALRERIRAGLNWYELVPVLDDLASLMLAVAHIGQREFEHYLAQLNERLAAMQDNLAVAREGHDHNRAAAEALDAELREQVGGLQSSVQLAPDLDSLKRTVESRLEGLLGTVDAYQRQRNEHEQVLGDRLVHLAERVAAMEQAASDLRGHLEEQRQKALEDSLTGLPNRAAWDDRLALEVGRFQRYGSPLVLAVLDIDHFKRINDAYGHLAGDRVLKIVAGELHKRVRKTDFIARFGGEEFVLLITDTEADGASQLLENLRKGVETCPFHFKGERVQVTFSAGFSAFGGNDAADVVFDRADKALYRAKDGGRNRIEHG